MRESRRQTPQRATRGVYIGHDGELKEFKIRRIIGDNDDLVGHPTGSRNNILDTQVGTERETGFRKAQAPALTASLDESRDLKARSTKWGEMVGRSLLFPAHVHP